MREFSFIKTSLWADETFRQMTPEQKIVMLYLLQGTQTNWCGIFKLNISMMGFFLGLRDDNVQNAFHSFIKHYDSLVAYDHETSEVAILNWGAMNLANMNEKSLASAARDLLDVGSEELILRVIKESKASRVVDFYTTGLNSIRATRRNLDKKRANIVSQPPLVTCCESDSYGQRESKREIERKVKGKLTPLPPCRGIGVVAETTDCSITSGKDNCTGNSAGKKETVPPPAARPAPPRRASWPLPADWQEVLEMNRLPTAPETLKPRRGNEWECRLLAFKVFYGLYPGDKGGLNKEFDALIKTCHKTKSDIDFVISVLPWGLKYHTDLKQKMRDDGEFVPGWKTMHNWLTENQWDSDNINMPRQEWAKAQVMINKSEYDKYDVRDILPKPTAK